ncbi:MAG: hypothetical protein UV60_C0012G0018 [Parcubacteria group bacterium GW2011_GWA2_43_11]|nr:MAG: hypothetical protein UV60_C0012G0018 [Parcubacteria group bacterium GW2011_GWA2_43_11]
MTQIAHAEMMTCEQIEDILDRFRRELLRGRSMNHRSAVLQLLDDENFGMVLYREFKKQVDAVGSFTVRRVTVNCNRTLQEALDAFIRALCANPAGAVDRMPIEGDKLEVVLFKPKPEEYTGPGFISDADIAKALKRRELTNNLMAVIAANEADPTLADQRPHYAHEADDEGNLHYVTILGGCKILTGRCNDAYVDDRLWIAGARTPVHERQEREWFV